MKAILSLAIAVIGFSACEKEEIKPINKPPYGGVVQTDTLGNNDIDSIVGTTWMLYKWSNGFQTTERSDTLYFINSFLYMYNSVRSNYQLTTSGSQYSLILEGTPIGDLSGLVPRNFIRFGELNSEMKDISNGQNGINYQVWLKKL
ncbi:MAG: hypothetical protein V4658_04005 [Bacteroidota bacterium]